MSKPKVDDEASGTSDAKDLSEVDEALAEIGADEEPQAEAEANADAEVADPEPEVDVANSDEEAAAEAAGEDAAESVTNGADGEVSVETLVSDLERVTAERNQYLEASQRLQAEFENYRKQVSRREADSKERANDGLINELLPVLDAFDGAVASGVDSVEPMRATMLDALTKSGLERLDPADEPFDPNQHEAVMHEEGGDGSGPVVAEVMRAGYVWKGRVLRPAMVKVIG